MRTILTWFTLIKSIIFLQMYMHCMKNSHDFALQEFASYHNSQKQHCRWPTRYRSIAKARFTYKAFQKWANCAHCFLIQDQGRVLRVPTTMLCYVALGKQSNKLPTSSSVDDADTPCWSLSTLLKKSARLFRIHDFGARTLQDLDNYNSILYINRISNLIKIITRQKVVGDQQKQQ